MNCSAVILAAGQSSRMGRDKAFLEIDGQSLLERQIATVRAAGCSEIFLSGRDGCDYSRFGLPVLHDRFPQAGPLAGIHAALCVATFPLLLVLAVDLPRINRAFLQKLAARSHDRLGVIPQSAHGIEPLVAFYPKHAAPLVETMLHNGEKAARLFAEKCVASHLAQFDLCDASEQNFLANWNEPADIKAP